MKTNIKPYKNLKKNTPLTKHGAKFLKTLSCCNSLLRVPLWLARSVEAFFPPHQYALSYACLPGWHDETSNTSNLKAITYEFSKRNQSADVNNNTQATEEKYTSKEYLENNPTWHVEDSPWKAKQILKIINKNNLTPQSLAEIGCGAGEILHQLHLQMDPNTSFVGYEISPHAFELCKQRATDRLDYRLENLFEKDDASYDVVTAIDVMEHVEDYFGFLRNLQKKGTYKILHIPLDMSVLNVLRMSPILSVRQKVGHIHYFSKDTALATLEDAGYEIIDWFYTAGSLDLSSGSSTFKSKLLKTPRKLCFKINRNLAARLLGGFSLMVLAK